MFIRLIDDGLEKLLRTELPLPPDLGEVSFDAPNGTWAAQLSRLTVNLYLYDVHRSNQPVRAPISRVGDDGRRERRIPLPMIRLSYLVSAWAGSVRDEHQLLGEVINRLAGIETLPKEYLTGSPAAPVDLSFAEDPQSKTREIWGGLGGQLKGSFTLHVTVAADAFEWTEEAPAVQRVEALTSPIPRESPAK
jgi:hypothetical protein